MFEPVNELIFIVSTHQHRHVYVDGTSLLLVIVGYSRAPGMRDD